MILRETSPTTRLMSATFTSSPENDNELECVEFKLSESKHILDVIGHQTSNDDFPSFTESEDSKDDSRTKLISRSLKRNPITDAQFKFPKQIAASIGLSPDCLCGVGDCGSVSFTRSPSGRFMLQTPLDDGPFCSIHVEHRNGFDYAAMHLYSDQRFAPLTLLQDQLWMYRWRWSGLPILILPIAFLVSHDRYISEHLTQLHSNLAQIESCLLSPFNIEGRPVDFGQLTRRLHILSTDLSNLARRAHFHHTVLSTIEAALEILAGKDPQRMNIQIQHERIEVLKKAMQNRQYDLETLPKREQTAKLTIFNLIVQRDQAISLVMGRANLEIAQSSRLIAEATMRDSAAMRIIAIMTMVFLPGTAVATFFSMTMFDWSPNSGESLVSNYVWIYFVAAVPLTVLVLGVWWFWQRREGATTVLQARDRDLELSSCLESDPSN